MAFAIDTVSSLVRIGTFWVAECVAGGVGKIGRVDDGEGVFGEVFWVVTVVLVEAFFESVVDGVDGGFLDIVAVEGVEIGFLDEGNDSDE